METCSRVGGRDVVRGLGLGSAASANFADAAQFTDADVRRDAMDHAERAAHARRCRLCLARRGDGRCDRAAGGANRAAKLAYINSAGNAIMKVDAASKPVAGKRRSVRISSSDVDFEEVRRSVAVLVDDAGHHVDRRRAARADRLRCLAGVLDPRPRRCLAERGCAGSQVQLSEACRRDRHSRVVNLGDQNAYTLHTTAGCKLAQPMAATGTIKNDDCDTATTDNASCGVSEAPGSAGAKFNAAKGGVIAAMCVRAWGLSDESDGRARRFRCTTGRARRFRPT